MAIQVRASGATQVYVTNGIHKRAVSDAERTALINMGLIPAAVQTIAKSVLDNIGDVVVSSNDKLSNY